MKLYFPMWYRARPQAGSGPYDGLWHNYLRSNSHLFRFEGRRSGSVCSGRHGTLIQGMMASKAQASTAQRFESSLARSLHIITHQKILAFKLVHRGYCVRNLCDPV
jgi:hypothetical protein